MNWTVDALCAGTAAPFRGRNKSAFAKQPVTGPVMITAMGLSGDQQADRKRHGGPDMALHHYPRDHHAYWATELGGHPLLEEPGAFASNLSTIGLTEGEVRLGDRFRLGTALIEACQPRQPCWKIEHRFDRKGMVKRILATRRCGWFYRVIEEGEARAGDILVREGPRGSYWTMAEVFEAVWGSSEAANRALLEEMAATQLMARQLREGIRDWLAKH